MTTKTCLFCGKEFVPKSNRQKYCDGEHIRECPICGGKYIEKFTENLSKPARVCRSCLRGHTNVPEFQIIERIGSNVVVDSTKPRGKYDNLNISKKLKSRGIDCVHVFPEDDVDRILKWCDNSKVVDASELKVYKLNYDYVQEFLEENDIVPFYNSTALALGLVREYEIMQVMTFVSPRYSRKHDYELRRICTKLGYNIPEGLDILSREVSLKLGVTTCISYIDLSKQFHNSNLESIGMSVDHVNVPHSIPSGVYDCGTEVYVF